MKILPQLKNILQKCHLWQIPCLCQLWQPSCWRWNKTKAMLWMPCPSLSPCFCRDLWHLCLKVHATFPKVPPTFTESCQTKLNEAKVCQDFEAKVCSRFWSWILLKIVGEIARANSLSVPLRNLILYATLCLNVLHFCILLRKDVSATILISIRKLQNKQNLVSGGLLKFCFLSKHKFATSNSSNFFVSEK